MDDTTVLAIWGATIGAFDRTLLIFFSFSVKSMLFIQALIGTLLDCLKFPSTRACIKDLKSPHPDLLPEGEGEFIQAGKVQMPVSQLQTASLPRPRSFAAAGNDAFSFFNRGIPVTMAKLLPADRLD